MIDTFSIPLAFIITASLTLWIVIGSKGWWWLKAAAVVFTSTFSVCLWLSLDELQGWPTTETIPETFEIKWIIADEPNKQTGSEGAIYIWIKNTNNNAKKYSWYLTNKHKNINNEPRMHKLPYNRSMHEQATEIQGIITQGGRFFAKKKGKGVPGKDGKDGKDGSGGAGIKEGSGDSKNQQGGDGSLSQSQDYIFHQLPPASYPQKNR